MSQRGFPHLNRVMLSGEALTAPTDPKNPKGFVSFLLGVINENRIPRRFKLRVLVHPELVEDAKSSITPGSEVLVEGELSPTLGRSSAMQIFARGLQTRNSEGVIHTVEKGAIAKPSPPDVIPATEHPAPVKIAPVRIAKVERAPKPVAQSEAEAKPVSLSVSGSVSKQESKVSPEAPPKPELVSSLARPLAKRPARKIPSKKIPSRKIPSRKIPSRARRRKTEYPASKKLTETTGAGSDKRSSEVSSSTPMAKKTSARPKRVPRPTPARKSSSAPKKKKPETKSDSPFELTQSESLFDPFLVDDTD